ncbi:hypothetical protein P20480_3358 [Pseudoalteromonas sp. BSi20480]|nr:hypothetical protein P20480_3358 [Pseudoalteromonas sp. BSi20480]
MALKSLLLKKDDNAQNPWAKRQSVGGNGQRRRRPNNND